MYILPIPYRFTSYSIGILLGYFMRTQKDLKFTKPQLNFGWFLIILSTSLTILLSSMMSTYNYSYNAIHSALFASVAPIPFCLFFAWTIFTAHLGYKKSKYTKQFHFLIIQSLTIKFVISL
jgi:hypothetical protein